MPPQPAVVSVVGLTVRTPANRDWSGVKSCRRIMSACRRRPEQPRPPTTGWRCSVGSETDRRGIGRRLAASCLMFRPLVSHFGSFCLHCHRGLADLGWLANGIWHPMPVTAAGVTLNWLAPDWIGLQIIFYSIIRMTLSLVFPFVRIRFLL